MSASQETPIPAIVAPQVLLGNHLKALKLPTFAREYEKVAMESAQDRADYPPQTRPARDRGSTAIWCRR